MKITDYLKATGYDYMPLPIGDGVTDNAPIINARIQEGFGIFPKALDEMPKGNFMVKSPIQYTVDLKGVK